MIKDWFSRLPSYLRNFYVLTGALFFVWLLFFDSNDLITQYKLGSKHAELEETKDFYQEKIEEVKADREALLNNDELLEKVAREKYYMKEEGEDVFVVVEKD
jgi:cell division protein DivIC